MIPLEELGRRLEHDLAGEISGRLSAAELERRLRELDEEIWIYLHPDDEQPAELEEIAGDLLSPLRVRVQTTSYVPRGTAIAFRGNYRRTHRIRP